MNSSLRQFLSTTCSLWLKKTCTSFVFAGSRQIFSMCPINARRDGEVAASWVRTSQTRISATGDPAGEAGAVPRSTTRRCFLSLSVTTL